MSQRTNTSAQYDDKHASNSNTTLNQFRNSVSNVSDVQESSSVYHETTNKPRGEPRNPGLLSSQNNI
jgi:hypothetical protein